ncbi:MAG: DUF1540 domain-containing protein [Candidatus Heimdallarchaeaceae archaeon]
MVKKVKNWKEAIKMSYYEKIVNATNDYFKKVDITEKGYILYYNVTKTNINNFQKNKIKYKIKNNYILILIPHKKLYDAEIERLKRKMAIKIAIRCYFEKCEYYENGYCNLPRVTITETGHCEKTLQYL